MGKSSKPARLERPERPESDRRRLALAQAVDAQVRELVAELDLGGAPVRKALAEALDQTGELASYLEARVEFLGEECGLDVSAGTTVPRIVRHLVRTAYLLLLYTRPGTTHELLSAARRLAAEVDELLPENTIVLGSGQQRGAGVATG